MIARVLAAALVALALTAAPAAAETAAEVRDLAARADRDPAALERLRQVDEVDGRPADFDQALDGAEGDELSRRLDVIEKSAGNVEAAEPPLTNDGAQREARRILETERYKPEEPPRPLAGVLERIGALLDPILGPIGDFFAAILGNPLSAGAVALGIVVAAALIASRLVRRGARAAALRLDRAGGIVEPCTLDPASLDKEADAAEAAGDFDRAFRLRFLAGVLRLDRAGVIEYRSSTTTGELVRAVRSAAFRPLARTFDEVAYGGRHPGPDELAKAKADWPRVLEEAGR